MNKRRHLGQYRCWLCNRHLKITTAPYQRNRYSTCYCKEDGFPGGDCDPPAGLTKTEITAEREKYLKSTLLDGHTASIK